MQVPIFGPDTDLSPPLPKDSRTCWGAEAALAGDAGSQGLPPTSGLHHPPSVLTGRQTRLSVSPHHSRRGDMLECSGPAPPPTRPDHPGSSRGRDFCWAARGRSGVKTGHCGRFCKTLSTSIGNQNSERGNRRVSCECCHPHQSHAKCLPCVPPPPIISHPYNQLNTHPPSPDLHGNCSCNGPAPTQKQPPRLVCCRAHMSALTPVSSQPRTPSLRTSPASSTRTPVQCTPPPASGLSVLSARRAPAGSAR